MHAKQRNPSRIQAQEVAQKRPECDAKVCLTRPSNPLKTLGPEPRLVCFIQRSNPIQTLLPHPRQRDACETAKPQQDSSPRGGQKGPGCDAKVCLTRPSNPLKTLGPEPRLVCFIQRSNPIQTLLPRPWQRVQNGETPRCASPDLRTVEKH